MNRELTGLALRKRDLRGALFLRARPVKPLSIYYSSLVALYPIYFSLR